MGIFVVSHKQLSDKPALVEGYTPFYVGPNREHLGAAGGIVDGSGDNIANLNSSFCELTALYWVWKNCDEPIKGIVHYRRFFEDARQRGQLMSLNFASDALENADLILPKKYWLLDTVEGHYVSHHDARDLELLRESVSAVQPGYLDAFDECMGLRYVYPYNMLAASSQAYDAYCSWLFSIMFDLRDRMATAGGGSRNAYQSRVYGFLSERLMNAYVSGSGVRVTERPVLLTEANLKRSVSMVLAALLYSRG